MKIKEEEVVLTIEQALSFKEHITNELKTLSNSLARSGNRKLLEELEAKEENLLRIRQAILQVNQERGNNISILKRDILVRKREVLLKVLKNNDIPLEKRKYFKLFSFTDLISAKEIIEKLTIINSSIAELNTSLSTFNTSETITLKLLKV